MGVCAWARVWAAPRHSWLACWGVCMLVCPLRLYPATPGWGVRCGCVCLGSGCRLRPATPGWFVGVCVWWCACSSCTPPLLAGVCGMGVCAWARVWAAPRHSWLGCWGVCVFVCPLRLYPATPGWGVRCGCLCFGSGFRCAPPLLAGVFGCVCARVPAPPVPRHSLLGCAVWVCVFGLGVSAAPRHCWLGCWGVCVVVCVLLLYPATPGWGVRRGCVSLGSGLGCAPPLLAGVFGCVCAGVGAPLAPCHSWLGCAVWVCVFGLGLGLRPATAGWGVGLWVCSCACSPCYPPLLAGVCGVGVCVWARVLGCAPPLLAGVLGCVCAGVRAPPVPRHSWLGCALWVCVLGLGFGLRPATPGWGLWCVGWLLPGTCSCAVVRCVLCALSGSVAPGGRRCLAPVRVPWSWPVACLFGVPLGPARCAAPRPVRSLSVLRSAFPTPWCLSPPRGLAPPALLGGCAGHAEAGREPGSLCLPLAPAEAGALGSPRVVPVRGPAMWLSLAGPSGAGLGLRALRWFACVDAVTDASGFPYRPSFDGGLGRCTGAVSCGRRYLPLRVGGRHARVPCVCACARSSWPGRAGRPPGRVLVRLTFSFGRFVFLLCSAPSGLGLPFSSPLFVPSPPRFALSFFFPLSVAVFRALPLSLAFFGFRPRVPWALALCVVSLVGLALLGPPCAFAPFVLPAWPLVVAWWSPPPFVSCGSSCRRSVPGVFFFLSSCPRFRCLSLSSPGCLGPWRWALRFFFLCFLALRVLSPFWCLLLGRWLLLGGQCPPPPLPFSVARFSSLPLGAVFFFFRFLHAPPLSLAFFGFRDRLPWALALCFVCFPTSRCSALCALSPRFCVSPGRCLLPGCRCPPPPCRSVLRSFFFFLRPRCLWLSLVSGPGCPGPRRCALFASLASRFSALRALSPLSCFPPGRWLLPGGCCPPPPFVSRAFRRFRSVPCAVLCCVSRGAVLRRAAARCVARCCGVVCCVILLRSFGAAACCALPSGAARRLGALCFAALCFPVFPLAVCVLLWRGVACRCSPLCFVLCVSWGAVLCVPCPLRSVRCCASLCWCACVVLFVWCLLLLAPGAVVCCCVLWCFLWCAVVRCWIWWPVVVCWCRAVAPCCSFSFAGVGLCLFPVCAVLCCAARRVVWCRCGLRCCWCLVLWRVPVRCGVSLGVLRCGGAALVCRGVLLCCALSCGVLRPVLCPAVLCCLAVLCWLAVLCGCLRCWCLFFLLSSFPLLKTPAVLPWL